MKMNRFFNVALLVAHLAVMFDASAMLGSKKSSNVTTAADNKSVNESAVKSDATMVVSVDIGKVISDADEFKAKREEIEGDLKKQAKPIEDLQKKIQEKQEKLSKGDKDMKDDAKEKLKKEVEEHSKEHMMHAQGFQMKAQAAEQKFVQFVQDRIKEVAKGLGYDIIVFPGASILVNDKFDKTDELIKKLNDLFKSKSGSSSKKAEPKDVAKK